MRLAGKFKVDFIGVERIQYNIDGNVVEGREIAYRTEQKYGNLKASKDAVEKLEGAGLAPFTPIVVEITIDTDVPNSRNYRVTGVDLSSVSGSSKSPAPVSDPVEASKGGKK